MKIPIQSFVKSFVILLFSIIVMVSSCKRDGDPLLPKPEETFGFNYPESWGQPVYNFENNTLTKEGFELGKKLFFEKKLSIDNSVSCGTCHQQFSAFAQVGHELSHGVNNLLGIRNSPPLFNLNWHTSFFWDGGVNHIEVQPIAPIINPVEMGETIQNVIEKLKQDEQYRADFRVVYGDDTINSQRMLKLLSQYMGMLISDDSKYDKVMRNESGIAFTASENRGYVLFQTHCNTCHTEPQFTDFSFRNNGLEPKENIEGVLEIGRAHITLNPADSFKFKVPSLRNLKYTRPYMHDGRVQSLDAVLQHYEGGIHTNPTLDPILNNGIKLTASEKQDLLDFLNTLNDETFVKNPLFAE